MKDTKDMQALAFQKLHELNRVIFPMILVDKSISEQTMTEIRTPMHSLDWEGKAKYADKLISILKTTKTEEEIIAKAKEALQSLCE